MKTNFLVKSGPHPKPLVEVNFKMMIEQGQCSKTHLQIWIENNVDEMLVETDVLSFLEVLNLKQIGKNDQKHLATTEEVVYHP